MLCCTVGLLALIGLGQSAMRCFSCWAIVRGGFRDALILVIGLFVAGMIFKVTGEAVELYGSKEKPSKNFGNFGRDSRDDYSGTKN